MEQRIKNVKRATMSHHERLPNSDFLLIGNRGGIYMSIITSVIRYTKVVPRYLFIGLVVFAVVTLSISSAHDAYGAQTTLTWDAPVTNVDGTPLTDLEGYKIYYGTGSGNYSQTIDVGEITSSTVSNLSDGTTYYFAVTAYDTSGNESAYSNEVSKTTQAAQQYSLSIGKSGAGSGTVTSSAGGINCGTACAATYSPGAVVTLTAAPAGVGTFLGWSGGGCTGTGTCSLSMNGNMTVTATFAANTYTVTATAGAGGTISPSGAVTVNSGTSKTFTITPTAGYSIGDVKVDGASVGAVTTYTFSNVTATHTIAATFAGNTYTISATAGAGGTMSPSGTVTVNNGTSKTFTIASAVNYQIADVKVDGTSVGAVSSYTFNSVSSGHTISATFSKVYGDWSSLYNNCSATLSDDLNLHVPIATYNGKSYWANFQYDQHTNSVTFINAGVVSDTSPFSSCTPPTVYPDLKVHLPLVTFKGHSYWADLVNSGGFNFTVVSVGKN